MDIAGVLKSIDFATVLAQPSFVFLFQLVYSMFLGMLLGIERNIAHQAAGMRTFGLVSMGACFFVLTSLLAFESFSTSQTTPDVFRVVEGVITGVGFLGAGIIIFRENTLRGLTTAAGLWVAAGIGMAVAFEQYHLAAVSTMLTLLAFAFFGRIEESVRKMVQGPEDNG